MRIRKITIGTLKCFGLFLAALLSASAMAQRSTDFALLDQHGTFHQLSRYGESELVVLFVQGNGESASQQAIPLLDDLSTRFTEQGVVVLLLNPDPAQSRDQIIEEMAQLGVDLPVLQDSAQLVARSLKVVTTNEALILDPVSHDVLYRGPLHSGIGVSATATQTPYLEQALVALLDGDELPEAELPAVEGTPVEYLYKELFGDRQISYQNEIAPILKRRCTTCHIEDGLAPWAMINHRMIQGWSPMIREVLITHRMPPGQIDVQEGEWDNIHEITDEELITLVHWIDSGARNADDADPLTEQEELFEGWALGEPDLVVNVPENEVPATGMVDFIIERSDLNLTQDQWVSAVAYNVGDRSVLHSLLVFAVDPNIVEKDQAGLIDPQNAEFISLYVPPRTEESFAEDSAFLLRQDRDLSFKIRYVTGGRDTIDATRIGLYFRDSPPEYAVRNVITLNPDFTVAAGVVKQVEHAETAVFENDVWVESFAPQTHTRGKSMTISAQFPDGSVERLINVANYNFNWQMNYKMSERLHLPAGSKLISDTVYDNSASNPQNVDPETDVAVGLTTYDEIFSHFIRVLEPVAQ
ncbi:MAG: redoxin domain-containing protein [Gammaproteobacteria bacterium]